MQDQDIRKFFGGGGVKKSSTAAKPGAPPALRAALCVAWMSRSTRKPPWFSHFCYLPIAPDSKVPKAAGGAAGQAAVAASPKPAGSKPASKALPASGGAASVPTRAASRSPAVAGAGAAATKQPAQKKRKKPSRVVDSGSDWSVGEEAGAVSPDELSDFEIDLTAEDDEVVAQPQGKKAAAGKKAPSSGGARKAATPAKVGGGGGSWGPACARSAGGHGSKYAWGVAARQQGWLLVLACSA